MKKFPHVHSKIGRVFLGLGIAALFFYSPSPVLSQTSVSPTNPAISCAPGLFITPHFRHSFDDARVRMINPMKNSGIAPSYPASYKCPQYCPPDFVLETAYYLECAWEEYETELIKNNLPMPKPVRERIPVEYLENYAVPLQFRHESNLYRERIAVCLQPTIFSRELHLHRTAHELFHFIQSHAVGGDKCSNPAEGGLWWIEATAEYAACDIVWSAAHFKKFGIKLAGPFQVIASQHGLSAEKGGGFTRAYPYLLDEALPFFGNPSDAHHLTGFVNNWDRGEELEYDKGYFIQFLVSYCGADFFKMNDAVLDFYGQNSGPRAILLQLDNYLRIHRSGMQLDKAYRDFASYYLLSADSPLARFLSVQPTPLISVMKPPNGQEKAAEIILDGVPIEQSFDLPGGFAAKMLAVELGPQANGGSQTPRPLQIEASRMDFSWAQVFTGPKGSRLYTRIPKADIQNIGTPAIVTLKASETLYIIVSGKDDSNSGKAVIRISDAPSLSLNPPAVKGVKSVPLNFQGTLRNYFGTGVVNFKYKSIPQLSPQSRIPKYIQGEMKLLARPLNPIETAQAITFPEAGRYELSCIAMDSQEVTIAESKPAVCDIEAASPEKGPVPSSASGSGYWRLREIKIDKRDPPADSKIIEFTVNVSEGSMFGKITTDNGDEGPATYGGQCSWSWDSPHGLDRLMPDETIKGSMTLTDQSIPEKVSGWQHGYTGISGTIRIDKPFLPIGVVDGSALDVVNLNAPYQQTTTQEGKIAIPKGPGSSAWGGKIALTAASSFGRLERIYEWTTEPYVPGKQIPVTVSGGGNSAADSSKPSPSPVPSGGNPSSKPGGSQPNPQPSRDVVGKWEYHADAYYVTDTHEFLPGGRMGNDPKAVWEIVGGQLMVTWPNGWVNVYPWDPRSHELKGVATNTAGTRVDIRLVRLGPAPSVEKESKAQAPTPSLGRVWRVHEASAEMSYDGVWTRRGSSNTFDAVWQSVGVTDTITIESISGDQVTLYRSGNSGRYVGNLSPDRKRIISGTMSWAPTFNWTATIE